MPNKNGPLKVGEHLEVAQRLRNLLLYHGKNSLFSIKKGNLPKSQNGFALFNIRFF